MQPNHILAMVIFAVIILTFVIIVGVGFGLWVRDFHGELQRLNLEIKRTSGEEHKYYKRKKRRLWLSLIPFVRYK